ncbi:MAG: zinc transporter ZntB [Alphaproteobacteria bacterium]
MTNSSQILCAYEIKGDGTGTPLSGDDITKKLKATTLAWVHLDATHPKTRGWLEENVSYLDPYILNALLATETRPRITEIKDGMLVILRGVNLNENANPEDMISIRLWIDENRIISTRNRKLKAISDMRARLEDGTGAKNASDFINMLCTRLFERMEPVLRELDDRTDQVEEEIIEKPDTAFRHEIIDIRKKAIVLRRYIAPQKDVLSRMYTSKLRWIDPTHQRQIHENLDRVTRYIEDLDAIRERASIIKDELANIMSDKMNKNMYVLSVVAAVFLPLGFLTGLLGINVGGMPGADNGAAFWIVCLLCVGVGIGLLALFKKLKWI